MEKSTASAPYTLFMLVISILSIVGIATLAVGHLSGEQVKILQAADFLVCAVFLVDFLVTLIRSPNRLVYLRTWGWLDLLSSIPMVDFLRFTRVARIFRILRLIRGVKSAVVLAQFIRDKKSESAFLAVTLISVLLVVLSSVAILQFESSPASAFKNAGDAVWWSLTTFTTVGYGDLVPVTFEGRVVASALMICGVALFGTFSGFVASWLLKPGPRTPSPDTAQVLAEIRELRATLEKLSSPSS